MSKVLPESWRPDLFDRDALESGMTKIMIPLYVIGGA
jgi:hypothetical protein